MTLDPPAPVPPASTEEAVREIATLVNKLTLQVIIAEAGLRHVVAALPVEAKVTFRASFRREAERLVQAHSEKLLPADDARISLFVNRLLVAARDDS